MVYLENFDGYNGHYSDDAVVEIRGAVQSDTILCVEDHNDFNGTNFNLDNYNQMVSLMEYNVYA